MPRWAANLPDAVVGLVPHVLEMFEQRLLQLPCVGRRRQVGFARRVQGVHDLAVDVELALRDRSVADAHGPALFVAGQPRHFELGQAPLAGDAVHDVQLLGQAGGSAQQPCAPGGRLVAIAGVEERVQRQRRIANPTVAVVPIAWSAQRLGQRRRRRRDDPARRRERQQLQRDQRAPDGVAPFIVVAGEAARLAPFAPPSRRGLHGLGAIRTKCGGLCER